ncbi:MAG: hypothetical protein L0Z50_09790 [Verrucomicrobiales bacterium]|nr:hypothetical protein [Verrucomicrobiales bacterium]
MNKLTPLEEGILTTTRDHGMIPFPQGTVRTIENIFRVLENMAKRGCVQYVNKTGYRAYWLTDKGRKIVRAIRAFQRKTPPHAAR